MQSGGGNWSNGTTWVGGAPPTTGDDVATSANSGDSTIDSAFTVTINSLVLAPTFSHTITAGTNLTVTTDVILSGGTFSPASYTINIGGNWNMTGGTFIKGTSTLNLSDNGANTYTFSGNGAVYNNLTIAGGTGGVILVTGANTFNNFTVGAPKTVTFKNGITQTINGTFTAVGTAVNLIVINSDLATSPATISHTTGYSTQWNSIRDITSSGSGSSWTAMYSIDGTGNTGGTGIVFPPYKTISAAGGNWSLLSTWVQGVVPTSGDYVAAVSTSGNVTVDSPANCKSLSLSGYTHAISLSSSLTVAADVTLSSGTISAGSQTIYVAGNWSMAGGTFMAGTGTVNLNGLGGTTQTISGNTTFNNLTLATTSARTVTLTNSSNQTIGGVFTANGTSGNLITINSDKSGTVATLTKSAGVVLASYLSVSDITAAAGGADWFTTNSNNVTPSTNLGWTFGPIAAANRYWVGASGTWSDASHWAKVSGGTPGWPAPTNIDTAIFDGNGNSDCSIDVAAVATAMSISNTPSAYTHTIAINSSQSLAVSGSLTLAAAGSTFNANGQTVSLGSLTQSNGTFTVGSSNITISGDVNLSGGIFNNNTGNVSVAGNWSNSSPGIFNGNPGTITFTKTSGIQTLDSGGTGNNYYFYNLIHSGLGTLRLTGNNLDINGDMTNSAGTLDSNTKNISTAGSWNSTGGTFTASSGTVTFDGSSSKTITPAGQSFNNLTINGSGGVWALSGDLTATNTLTVTNGTLTAGANNLTVANYSQNGGILNAPASSKSLNVSGGWTNSSGTFNHNSGTVTFNGTASGKTITAGTQAFNGLTISGTGGGWTLSGDTTVSGLLSISAGTLSTGTGTLTENGNLTVASPGVLTATTNGTVKFNGTVSQTINAPAQTFYNLNSNVQSADLNIFSGQAITVNGTLTLSSGSNFKGGTINVADSIVETSGFNGGNTAYNIAGTGTQTISGTGTGTSLTSGRVTINNNAVLQLNNSTAITLLTIASGGILDLHGQGFTSTTANFQNSGTLKMTGDELVPNAPTLNSGSTVEYTAGSSTRDIKGWVYQNLKINGTNGTFTLPSGTTTVSGNVIVAAGTFSLLANTLNVAGDWSKTGGTFMSGTSTVNLNGSSAQSILDANSTFNNLTISNSATNGVTFADNLTVANSFNVTDQNVKKVTFASGKTYAIKSLNIDGNHTSRLTLAASSTSQWNLTDLSGTNTVAYVDVRYSNASIVINATNSKNSLNNHKWNLIGQIVVTVPSTGMVHQNLASTITLNDAVGGALTETYGNIAVTADSGISTISPYSIDASTLTGGFWSGNLILTSVGSRTVTFSANSATAIATIKINPGVLDHFMISAQTSTNAALPFSSQVSVRALDYWDNVKIDYTGNIHFISNDPRATLPYVAANEYTFTSLDAGSHSFAGTGFALYATGTKNITVTNTDESISAHVDILVNPGALYSLEMTGIPDNVVAGNTFGDHNITVTAKDVAGNTKTDYIGNVWFTTSDQSIQRVLPYTATSKYSFTGSDNGIHIFPGSGFTLIVTSANRVITLCNDNDSIGPVYSDGIIVRPGSIDHFGLLDYPNGGDGEWETAGSDWSQGGATAGDDAPYDVNVTAYDRYNNIKTDFDGPVWFSTAESVSSVLPYSSADNAYIFTIDGSSTRTTKSDGIDNGTHIFDANSFTINNSGKSLQFNVNTSGNITSNFQVEIKPAATRSATVVFNPSISTQLVDNTLDQSVTVTVLDAAGNRKSDYTGDVFFSIQHDPTATLPYTSAHPYTFTSCDLTVDPTCDNGSRTFTPNNTPNYFTFRTGGERVLSAKFTDDDGNILTAESPKFIVSAHKIQNVVATAGYQQVILDWPNPPDQDVTSANIYKSNSADGPWTLDGSQAATSNPYSRCIVDDLTNDTTYYFTIRTVIAGSSQNTDESVGSDPVSAKPADIAPRNVSAIQLTGDANDGKVKIDYSLRWTSRVTVQYLDPADSNPATQWHDATEGSLSGDFGNQHGDNPVYPHTVYWLAKNDFNGKYYPSNSNFQIRISVVVSSQGNQTAAMPSSSFALDTKAPSGTSVTVDASNNDTANIQLQATDDSAPIEMRLSDTPDFAKASWQAYATSVTNFNLNGSANVYAQFRDSFYNEVTVTNALIPVVSNFMIKDNSDLRIPSYVLFVSWQAATVSTVDKYIVERKSGNGDYIEIARTVQTLYVDPGLDKDNIYSYRVKVLDTAGNISRPTESLSSRPGLAPDISNIPQVQVFGYKENVGVRAVFTWKTDQLADSFVAYSTDQLANTMDTTTISGVKANVQGQLDRVMEHEVDVSGLLPGKTYTFKVLSENDIKITGYSNVSQFTTPPYTPLQIDDLQFTDITPTSVWVSWTTNKLSSMKLYYGIDDAFDKVISDDTFNTEHKFKIDNLAPGSNYKLKIMATDQDGNSVNSDKYAFNPPSNPEVSGVVVKLVTNDTATIAWSTNVNTDSNVEFGPTSVYGFQSGKSDDSTIHEVTLIGLTDKTTYHYKVKSKDVFGNTAQSGDLTFVTTSDTTPPVLNEIQSQLAQVSTPQGPMYQSIISWKTDEGSTSQIEFGDNAIGQYSKKTQADPSLNMTHVVILSDLRPNSAYSYRVVSIDKSGNEARSQNYTVITPPQEQSLVQLVVSTLGDTFSWTGKLRAKWFGKK